MSKHRKIRMRCLLPREKKGIGAKKAQKHPVCQRKIEGGVAKRLANVWRRVNIKKKARAVRGQEIKWEIPDENGTIHNLPECKGQRTLEEDG